MTNAGMIEEALCDFFRSNTEFEFIVTEESADLFKLAQPGMTWHVSGATFEKSESGVLMEKLNAVCLVSAKNQGSEKYRRAEAYEISQKVTSSLSEVSLTLSDGSKTGIFAPTMWADATGDAEFGQTLMLVRIEFSVSMPAQANQESIEYEKGNSLKENIRVGVKRLLEAKFGYRTLPTLGNWKFLSSDETLAKVFWSGASESIDVSAYSFMRRQDTLNIVVAVPNTPENWQDKTSLIEEAFNYSIINRDMIRGYMSDKIDFIASVAVSGMSIEYPALPEAYAVSKISVIVQYAIKGLKWI